MQQPKPDTYGDGLPSATADQCPIRSLPTAAQPVTAAELARQLKRLALGGEQ